MKSRIPTLICAILISVCASAQKDVSLILPGEPICPQDKATYTARALYNGQDTLASSYIWDMDNGDVLETGEPYLQYAYPEGGAYMVRLSAVFADGSSAADTEKIMVGKRPDFGGYSNDMDPKLRGICLGSAVELSLQTKSQEVKYQCHKSCMEKNPQSIYNSYWLGRVSLKCFGGRTTTGSEIEAILLTASTDRAADLKIELSMPDGNSLTLKDYDEPMPDGTPVKSKAGNMMQYRYEPRIEGCPLDGDWTMKVSSRGMENEAYILGYELCMSEEILNAISWQYLQEYDMRRAVWSGKGVSATSNGVAKVTPLQDGNSRYSFLVTDNLGCIHDTTVYVSVERATFSGADSTTFIGDEISFDCQASWAAETSWSFGDKTPTAHGSPAPHAYYEKGKYMIVMQARAANGCIDVDTQFVSIVPRPLEVKEVNIFTPNGDGQNDVFTFFQEDESFLANGGLTRMPANIRSIKGKIYNVYGQTVYKWDEVEASVFGWDGTWHNKGSRGCPPGTYFYDIIVYGKDGNSLKRTGSILLVREK